MKSGFSLIELMIVLAIISILTTFAYSSYTHHVVRTRRVEGKVALMDLAARMERFYLEKNSYLSATIATHSDTDVLASEKSSNGWYKLVITIKDPHHYVLAAIPQNSQAIDDPKCGTLTLSDTGVRGMSSSGDVRECW